MRPKSIVFLVLVAALINLPMLHGIWLNSKLDRQGVDVTAEVIDDRDRPGDYLIAFRVPAEGDREEFTGVAKVDQETHDQAVRTQEIEVRILPDTPGAYRVEGQVTGRVGLVITLLADLLLVILVGLMLKFRSRLRPALVLVATEDLARCPPGSLLDRVDGDRYVVAGEIVSIEADEILLELGDRRVRVVLDGHHNPAGHDQPVRATGRMVR